MPKFRKPQVEIELEEFIASVPPSGQPKGVCYCGGQRAHLHTMHEGQVVLLESGDWIAPEPNGTNYYPIKPEVVAKWERID